MIAVPMQTLRSCACKALGVSAAARAALLIAAMQIGGFVIASCEAAAQTKSGDTLRVTADQLHQLSIVKVELYPFRPEKSAIGQIAYNEDASTAVLAPFSGRVLRLIAKLGDSVEQGTPLLEIDSSEVVQPQNDLIAAATAMNKARSQLELAQIIETRQKNLYEGRAGALKEWQQAEAKLQTAENDLRAAETALEAARHRLRIIGLTEDQIGVLQRTGSIRRAVPIYSPIAGTVVARKVGPGQYVRSDPSDQLYTIADLSTVWLKAYVPENDIPFIGLGQELEVKVNAIPNRTFKARVTHIGAMFDATTRRMLVRSEVPNPDGVLKSEMFASFKITTGESVPAPALPSDAVIRERDLAAVWVQEEPLLFRRRLVRIGMEQRGRIEIREGVKAGELAVARGAIFLDNEWRQ